MNKEIDYKNNKIYQLDGLKGILACIIAFFWHYNHFAPVKYPFFDVFKPLYMSGRFATDLFFAISGFVVVIGFENKILLGKVLPVEFLERRIKKFLPSVVITTVVTAILQLLTFSISGQTFNSSLEEFSLYNFLLNIFLMQIGYGTDSVTYNLPLWYVSVLLICYILHLLVIATSKTRSELLIFKYYFCFVLGITFTCCKFNISYISQAVGRGILAYFIGVFLAKIYMKKDIIRKKRVGIASFLIAIFSYYYFYNRPIESVVLLVVFDLMVIPVVILMSLFCPIINKILSSYIFRKLGKYSIAIYFWHFPVQILWNLIAVYYNLQINYSSPLIWGAYILSVIIFAFIYDKFIKSSTSIVYRFFIKG